MTLKLAVLGATNMVGKEILSVLDERQFPADEVIALSSRKAIGSEVSMGDKTLRTKDVEQFDFSTCQLCIMAVSDAAARKWAQKAASAGCIVIDTSAAFRLDGHVPLIVPEVNAAAVEGYERRNIIACPDAATAMLAVALKPLHEAAGVTRAVVTTFQSASDAGQSAMDELWVQTKGLFVNQPPEPKEFPRQMAFNVIPQVDDFLDDGFTEAEHRISAEIRRLIDPDIQVVATCVRVPVFAGHAEAVHVELNEPLSAEEARRILREAPGVMLVDRRTASSEPDADGEQPSDPTDETGYITPVDVVGEWATFVSRVRDDPTVENGLALWVVADNLRAGGALNAVQVAELLLNRGVFAPAIADQ
jgi:aspartate-semialdehyde dehydrogenase